jgi:hypothetical protein
MRASICLISAATDAAFGGATCCHLRPAARRNTYASVNSSRPMSSSPIQVFEEHEERNIVIVVRHVGIARLAFRRGQGIEGSLSAVKIAGPVPEEFAGAAVSPRTGPYL